MYASASRNSGCKNLKSTALKGEIDLTHPSQAQIEQNDKTSVKL